MTSILVFAAGFAAGVIFTAWRFIFAIGRTAEVDGREIWATTRKKRDEERREEGGS